MTKLKPPKQNQQRANPKTPTYSKGKEITIRPDYCH